jgi:hypothetical protein
MQFLQIDMQFLPPKMQFLQINMQKKTDGDAEITDEFS